MSVTARRERERAQRHQLIIKAARELAEAEGWDAVTTRRLAERVEYSQPVLYSHFDGKDAIVRAVAIQGFEELAARLAAARLGVGDGPGGGEGTQGDEHRSAEETRGDEHRSGDRPQGSHGGREALRAVCRAYLDFAVESPALYQAMFVMPTDVKFASEQTPPPLQAGFGEFVSALPAGTERRELVAEVTWSALHRLAVLTASGRIPVHGQDERIEILVASVVGR